MLSDYKTEQVGISAEVALADLAGVEIEDSYRRRSRPELVQHITPVIKPLLEALPKPIKHIAEDQSPIDFKLAGDLSLSVKSNMQSAGKIAPQIIGQPTSKTFWERLPQLVPEGIDVTSLEYAESSQLFKEVAQSRIIELLEAYWSGIFHCDYLIHVFDVIDK